MKRRAEDARPGNDDDRLARDARAPRRRDRAGPERSRRVTADKAEARQADARTPSRSSRRRDARAEGAVKAQPTIRSRTSRWRDVLRLQGKPAKDVKRYLDTAKAEREATTRSSRARSRSCDALVLARATASSTMRQGRARRDRRTTVRWRSPATCAHGSTSRCRVRAEQAGRCQAARRVGPRAQAEHDGREGAARAELETTVAKTDPLPPEDGGSPKDAGAGSAKPPTTGGSQVPSAAATYDSLLARANKLAESNCTQGDRAVRQGARAEAERRRGADRAWATATSTRSSSRARSRSSAPRSPCRALRAGALGRRRDVPAARAQGAGDRGVAARTSTRTPAARRRRSSSIAPRRPATKPPRPPAAVAPRRPRPRRPPTRRRLRFRLARQLACYDRAHACPPICLVLRRARRRVLESALSPGQGRHGTARRRRGSHRSLVREGRDRDDRRRAATRRRRQREPRWVRSPGHAVEDRRQHREARAVRGAREVEGLRRGQAALGRARRSAGRVVEREAFSLARRQRHRAAQADRSPARRSRRTTSSPACCCASTASRSACPTSIELRAAMHDLRTAGKKLRLPHRGRARTRRTSCWPRATRSGSRRSARSRSPGRRRCRSTSSRCSTSSASPADFLHVGAYKGAAEPLTRDAPSKEMEETLGAILDRRYQTMIDMIAAEREARSERGQDADRHGAVPLARGQGGEARRRCRRRTRRSATSRSPAEWTKLELEPGGKDQLADDAQARAVHRRDAAGAADSATTSRWSTRSATSSTVMATVCSVRGRTSPRTRWSRRCARSPRTTTSRRSCCASTPAAAARRPRS